MFADDNGTLTLPSTHVWKDLVLGSRPSNGQRNHQTPRLRPPFFPDKTSAPTRLLLRPDNTVVAALTNCSTPISCKTHCLYRCMLLQQSRLVADSHTTACICTHACHCTPHHTNHQIDPDTILNGTQQTPGLQVKNKHRCDITPRGGDDNGVTRQGSECPPADPSARAVAHDPPG